MKDIELIRLWRQGLNTAEIASAMGAKEHDVDRKLAKARNDMREQAMKFSKFRNAITRNGKRGFTGREFVSK